MLYVFFFFKKRDPTVLKACTLCLPKQNVKVPGGMLWYMFPYQCLNYVYIVQIHKCAFSFENVQFVDERRRICKGHYSNN